MKHWRTEKNWTYLLCDLDAPVSDFVDHASIVSKWNEKRKGGRLPAWRDFELDDFKGWWGWLTVFDLLEADGSDVKYRLWGTSVTDLTGIDMTGKQMSDQLGEGVDSKSYNSHDMASIMVLVEQRKIGLHNGPVDWNIRNYKWMSTVRIPLADDGENIDKFLSAVYATSDTSSSET